MYNKLVNRKVLFIAFTLHILSGITSGHTSMASWPVKGLIEGLVRTTRYLSPNSSLRRFNDSDAKELFKVADYNRAYLRKWLPWLDEYTQEKHSLDFIRKSNNDIANNIALTLGVFNAGKIVGVISFHEINWNRREAGIGYWIEESSQGKGLATLACKELINIGFLEIGLERITISCATENNKSKAIPTRLGFCLGETIKNKERLYDRYVDHTIYLMTRDRWLNMHPIN